MIPMQKGWFHIEFVKKNESQPDDRTTASQSGTLGTSHVSKLQHTPIRSYSWLGSLVLNCTPQAFKNWIHYEGIIEYSPDTDHSKKKREVYYLSAHDVRSLRNSQKAQLQQMNPAETTPVSDETEDDLTWLNKWTHTASAIDTIGPKTILNTPFSQKEPPVQPKVPLSKAAQPAAAPTAQPVGNIPGEVENFPQLAQEAALTLQSTTMEFPNFEEVVKQFKDRVTTNDGNPKSREELEKIYTANGKMFSEKGADEQEKLLTMPDRIEKLRGELAKKITDHEIRVQGQVSLNRDCLTNSEYQAYFQDEEFLRALFAAEALIASKALEEETLQIHVFQGRSITITGLIKFGLEGNGPEALESLPINRAINWGLRDQPLSLPPFTHENQTDALQVYVNRKRYWKQIQNLVTLLGGKITEKPPQADSIYDPQKWGTYNTQLVPEIASKIDAIKERTSKALHSNNQPVDEQLVQERTKEILLHSAASTTPEHMKAQSKQGFIDLCRAMGIEPPNLQKEGSEFKEDPNAASFTINLSFDDLVDQISKASAMLIPEVSHGLDRLHLLAALLDTDPCIVLNDQKYSLKDIYLGVFQKLADSPTPDRAIAAEQFYLRLKMILQGIDDELAKGSAAAAVLKTAPAAPKPAVDPIAESLEKIYGGFTENAKKALYLCKKGVPHLAPEANQQLMQSMQELMEILSNKRKQDPKFLAKQFVDRIVNEKDDTKLVKILGILNHFKGQQAAAPPTPQ